MLRQFYLNASIQIELIKREIHSFLIVGKFCESPISLFNNQQMTKIHLQKPFLANFHFNVHLTKFTSQGTKRNLITCFCDLWLLSNALQCQLDVSIRNLTLFCTDMKTTITQAERVRKKFAQLQILTMKRL